MMYLIINADDFGYSKVFNKKILELLEKGFVTSTSAMVKWIDDRQKEQVEKLKELVNTKGITVGLHTEFDGVSFRKQIDEQIDQFRSIFGFAPAFLDIHKSTYLKDGYPVIMQYCADNGIPCKNHDVPGANAIMTKDPTYGGTGKTLEEIGTWIKSLKPGETYLIAFHPGIYDPDSKSSFNEIREKDAEMILRLNTILNLKPNSIQLVSFKHLFNS